MSSLSHSERSLIRRYWLAVVVSVVLSILVVAPANAQEEEDPTGQPAGEEPTGPPPDTVDTPDAGTDAAEETPPVNSEEETVPEPEPVVRELVDDGDRTIQIVEHEISAHPFIDVVVAVPPALAGDLQQGSFSLTENGNVRSVDVV